MNHWIITNTYTIHNKNIIVASNGGLSARCFLSLSFTLFVFIWRAIVASYSRSQNLGIVVLDQIGRILTRGRDREKEKQNRK